jgi:hypothetical protein
MAIDHPERVGLVGIKAEVDLTFVTRLEVVFNFYSDFILNTAGDGFSSVKVGYSDGVGAVCGAAVRHKHQSE